MPKRLKVAVVQDGTFYPAGTELTAAQAKAITAEGVWEGDEGDPEPAPAEPPQS